MLIREFFKALISRHFNILLALVAFKHCFNLGFSKTEQDQTTISLFSEKEAQLSKAQIKVNRDDMYELGIEEVIKLPTTAFIKLDEIKFFDRINALKSLKIEQCRYYGGR